MAKELKILIVDDHPMTIEGYKKVLLETCYDSIKYNIDTANSCDEASEKIESSLEDGLYDIIFLDIGLPPSQDRELLSGEDIGQKIKEVSPETRLIVLTMTNENARLLNILKVLNPEGFLIKSDMSSEEFLLAFNKVLEGKKYSSHTVDKLMRNQITNDFQLDKIDRKILLYLSEGIKTKNLPDVIPVSLASVEKRKKIMRKVFEVEDFRDITLINKAREFGFL